MKPIRERRLEYIIAVLEHVQCTMYRGLRRKFDNRKE